jgi:hypothetical protein
MTTIDQAPASWVEAAYAVLSKQASGQDDRAVAEAFAQQAYTTISNRCRELMRDPYLLGFEIVEKNEENTRLLGVFAFRVGGIVLAPVFYLNGQIKGQDLLYRKGPNLFTRNDEKWIRYLLAQTSDNDDGRSVARGSGNARMHLGLGEFYNGSPGFRKSAGADADFDITACFREAFADAPSLMKRALEDDGILSDFLLEAGVAKSAALLVERVPEVGDAIALTGVLDAPPKVAAAKPFSGLVWHAEPSPDMTEEQVSEFYRKGYLLVDKRAAESKATAYTTAETESRVATAYEPGVMNVMDRSGGRHKALVGPASISPVMVLGGGSYRGRAHMDYLVLFLEGPHKDTTHRIRGGNPSQTPLVEVTPPSEGDIPEGVEPKAGGRYLVWITGAGFHSDWPLDVYDTDKAGDSLRLNTKDRGSFSVVRRDIDNTESEGNHTVYGADAVFIRIGDCNRQDSYSPKATDSGFVPMTPVDFMFGGKKSKTASVRVTGRHGLNEIEVDGNRVCDCLSHRQTVLKLARDFKLPVGEAEEIAGDAAAGKRVDFTWIAPVPAEKLARFFFDRPIDPEVEFDDENWDEDFDIPTDVPEKSFRAYATREVNPSPERHYLDVRDPQTRNPVRGRQGLTHLPDEVIMNMANPGVELSELGRRMGLTSLMDHGAVASMAKVFDAKTFIGKYVDRMEKSLDALGRVIFLLYWKPRDFSEMFGEDDISVLENKLTGVFQSYGDLVLELLQSVGDKIREP